VTRELVTVEWWDAHADPSGGWHRAADTDQRGYLVTSIGWLLPPDEGGKPDHVTVAQSLGGMEGDEPDDFDHVLHVYAPMVRNVRHHMLVKEPR